MDLQRLSNEVGRRGYAFRYVTLSDAVDLRRLGYELTIDYDNSAGSKYLARIEVMNEFEPEEEKEEVVNTLPTTYFGIGIRKEDEGQYRIWAVRSTGEAIRDTILILHDVKSVYSVVQKYLLTYATSGVIILPISLILWSKIRQEVEA